jgi:hypothetical protein
MLLIGMSLLYPRLPMLYRQEVSSQGVCIYILEVNQERGVLNGEGSGREMKAKGNYQRGAFDNIQQNGDLRLHARLHGVGEWIMDVSVSSKAR